MLIFFVGQTAVHKGHPSCIPEQLLLTWRLAASCNPVRNIKNPLTCYIPGRPQLPP